jgi:uncharacterized protein
LARLKHDFVLTRFFANDIIRAVMPQQPARFPLIDGFEFAAAGGIQRGVLPVSAFPRLRDALHDDSGTVEYEVRGGSDAHGRAQLTLRARTTLQLTCQRCLGAVQCKLEPQATLLLAASQSEIDAEPITAEMPERIVAHREMSVRDMVEDELLLALPYAPRHENCSARSRAAPEERQRPFATLRGMLRGKSRH